MAKKPTAKMQAILDGLDAGKEAKEIREETGSSLNYIYAIKRDVFPNYKKEDGNNGDDGDDGEMTDEEKNDVDGFVKQIKIKPDPNVLTGGNDDKDKKKENDFEEYQCGSCGAIFQGDSGTFQRYCPSCGVELA